ncbi:D-2-hydroxyacid dehydrogenase [Lacrimispora sp. JR3]|uniref:D-2-hydroxyacid dehydrogenase n=1 Tax=Lacrimispora sinapis TaxID=3111456 RepID=UPI0037489D2B
MNALCMALYQHIIPKEWHADMLFIEETDIDKLPASMKGIEIFIGQPYLVKKSLLDKLPDLTWVQITGAGYDRADVDYLKERNLLLTNTRDVMSISIAEDVFSKMLFFTRRMREFESARKDHRWESFGSNQWMSTIYRDLYGKTIGIVGDGSIAGEIAVRAGAFGMKVLAYGRTDKKNPVFHEFLTGREGLKTLAEHSDVMVIAIPHNPETEGLIDREFFRWVKKDCIFINVARGAIVEEQALIEAIKEKKLYAALDVFEQEPLSEDSELWELDRVYLTSHKSGAGDSWVVFLKELITENLAAYQAGRPLKNQIPL